jgi:hypothetical protein
MHLNRSEISFHKKIDLKINNNIVNALTAFVTPLSILNTVRYLMLTIVHSSTQWEFLRSRQLWLTQYYALFTLAVVVHNTWHNGEQTFIQRIQCIRYANPKLRFRDSAARLLSVYYLLDSVRISFHVLACRLFGPSRRFTVELIQSWRREREECKVETAKATPERRWNICFLCLWYAVFFRCVCSTLNCGGWHVYPVRRRKDTACFWIHTNFLSNYAEFVQRYSTRSSANCCRQQIQISEVITEGQT